MRPLPAHIRTLTTASLLALAATTAPTLHAQTTPASTPSSTSTAAPTPPQTSARATTDVVRVLVAHPVVSGLARQVTAGTSIELVQAAPARLPASRQPSYLAGRGLDALLTAAADAHAVLTLRSVWSDDQLYPLARRGNIRIVEIDVANPVEGDLPGISMVRTAQTPNVLTEQPWQNSANLASMATLMADALARLAPSQARTLQANAAAIHHRLQQAETHTTRALAQASELPVLLLSPRVRVLSATLQLEPVPWQAPQDDALLPAALAHALAQHQPRAVLTHTPPDAAVAQIVQAAGATLVVLPENASDPVQALAQAMQAIAQAMTQGQP